jgi:hypothetical protein
VHAASPAAASARTAVAHANRRLLRLVPIREPFPDAT